ncbi:MAG: hypothetical protein E6R08_00355 [Nevskiaceae bacterium]|nr:MAG: hypothetical protein E6R08_00355 [Nevskiaceae bacterium]
MQTEPSVSGSSQLPAAVVLAGASDTNPQAGAAGGTGGTGDINAQNSGGTTGGDAGAGAPAGAASGGGSSVDDQIKKIRQEGEERAKRLKEDTDRRIALVMKNATPLPQRKTQALDFLDRNRDKLRGLLVQPLMPDADVDALLQQALDSHFASLTPPPVTN